MNCKLLINIPNREKENAAADEYVQMTTQNGKNYLFTKNQLKIAENRAAKNKEDLQTVTFKKWWQFWK